MDAKVKALLVAALVGGGAALGSEQLAKVRWMQDHPQAWYVEGAGLGVLAYLLRKKNFTAALALVAAGGVMIFQGYRHGGTSAAPAMGGGGAVPQQLPAPASGGASKPQAGPSPAQLPANGNPGFKIPSVSGDVPQGDQSTVDQIIGFLGDLGLGGEAPPGASPDNAGAMVRRLDGNSAGAMLKKSALRLGRRYR